jgi:hypothetical protein
MTTRKRALVLPLAAVAALTGAAFAIRAWLAPIPHRINQASYEQIRGGMTEEEVIGILGVPPGHYYRGDCFWGQISGIRLSARDGKLEAWVSGMWWIEVAFSPEGKVRDKRGGPSVQPHEPTLLECLRRWARL